MVVIRCDEVNYIMGCRDVSSCVTRGRGCGVIVMRAREAKGEADWEGGMALFLILSFDEWSAWFVVLYKCPRFLLLPAFDQRL